MSKRQDALQYPKANKHIDVVNSSFSKDDAQSRAARNLPNQHIRSWIHIQNSFKWSTGTPMNITFCTHHSPPPVTVANNTGGGSNKSKFRRESEALQFLQPFIFCFFHSNPSGRALPLFGRPVGNTGNIVGKPPVKSSLFDTLDAPSYRFWHCHPPVIQPQLIGQLTPPLPWRTDIPEDTHCERFFFSERCLLTKILCLDRSAGFGGCFYNCKLI